MNIEDVVELNMPLVRVDVDELRNLPWQQYNLHKPNNRFVCSITSLDGGVDGGSELGSLREHNAQTGSRLTELSFSTPTTYSTPFRYLLDNVVVGRSRFLQMKAGGFFPWHRDPDPDTFRLIFTIRGCTKDSLVWVNDDKVLDLHDGSWYIINTKKKHCVFSLKESTFAIFNVADTPSNWQFLYNHFAIK